MMTSCVVYYSLLVDDVTWFDEKKTCCLEWCRPLREYLPVNRRTAVREMMHFGCRTAVVRLSSGCRKDVVRLSSGCRKDVVRLSRFVVRLSYGCRPVVVRSFFVVRLSSGCRSDQISASQKCRTVVVRLSQCCRVLSSGCRVLSHGCRPVVAFCRQVVAFCRSDQISASQKCRTVVVRLSQRSRQITDKYPEKVKQWSPNKAKTPHATCDRQCQMMRKKGILDREHLMGDYGKLCYHYFMKTE